MLLHRRILFVLTVVLVPGSLGASSGYALYVRSDAYRNGIASSLGEFLSLPAEIAGVEPRSRVSRGFRGISLYLPGRETQIFAATRTVWQEVEREDRTVNELDVYDGWLQLGSSRMGEGNYRDVLRSGLAHDFAALNLGTVRFHDMDLRWRQPELRLEARRSEGVVTFEPDGSGNAQLEARTLNGVTVSEPILIRAAFVTGVDLVFHNIALHVPRMPISALALEDMTGAAVTHGWFDGSVSFRPSESEQVYTLRGTVDDARLEDFTRTLATGAIRGRADLDLTEARVARGRVLALAFSGKLSEIQLADLGKSLGAADLAGRAELTIGQCRFAAGALDFLNARAEVVDVPAEVITRLIGRGRITGAVRLRINSLLIEDEVLRHADIDVDVQPPAGAAGIIEREVVLAIAREAFDVDLGRVGEYLPASVEYARMGCKLIADGNELRIRGSHGADGQTVLTLRVFNRDVAVLDAPQRSYPLGDILERIRERIENYDVRTLLRRLQGDAPGD